MATLAERLTEALRVKNLSNREVARALKKAGTPISHAYIGLLCNGTKVNPTLEQMEALARFLGVTVGWLAGEDVPRTPPAEHVRCSLTPEEEYQQQQVVDDLTALGVLNVAERMTGLSPLSIEAIATMVEAMRAAEQLDQGEDA
ncbi:helix-turn-helix domain-containing protein [Streptosporangium sp. NPDC006013]|uniref:helix-turn-helix domain-containing protein n=1 Tax=Streptosporangium sp. NPDC006013 TaxID=3155596 RepID=UPI00339F1373